MKRALMVLGLLLASGCAYFEDRAVCSDACKQILDEQDGCGIDFPNPNVGPKTAVFVCTEACVSEEDSTKEAFFDCVHDNSCDEIETGSCDIEELRDAIQ